MENNNEIRQQLIQALAYPSGYAKIRLGIKKLHPTQAKVLDTLFSEPKTKICFRCGNEVGKSSIIAVTAILYAIEVLNAMVISTSASHRQIVKQLVPYLKQYSKLFPKWEFLENSIKVNGETRYIGFATSNEGTAQGWHEQPNRPLVVIVDEAAGVEESIFMGMSRCNPTYFIIMGSPLGPEGFFYAACTDPIVSKTFKQFKLSKPECYVEDGWWLHRKDVEDFIEMWKDNPLVRSSVYAEFSTNIESGIITLSEIKACLNTIIPRQSGNKHIGIDFSAGGDKNVIAYKNGNQIDIIKEWREKDTMLAARQIVEELNKLKDSDGITPVMVSGDADGLGLPIIHRIKELGWPINEFHGNAAPNDINYKNAITEAWIELSKQIKLLNIIIPDNQELILQLTSRKQYMHNSGKIMLEPKADMRARGLPSPDLADAVSIAYRGASNGILTYCMPFTKPKESCRFSF